MHKFKDNIINILNQNSFSVGCITFKDNSSLTFSEEEQIHKASLDLNNFYKNLNDKDKFEFIDNLFFVFRNSVHNISRKSNNLFFIKSILYFYDFNNINDLILDSNDIICFSFPFRHQVYDENCYFSEDFIALYEYFFNENNIFLKYNKQSINMAISEIQDFIHIGIDRCPNEINKLFSNETIFKYFYNHRKYWLKNNLGKSKISIIRNKFLIEEF